MVRFFSLIVVWVLGMTALPGWSAEFDASAEYVARHSIETPSNGRTDNDKLRAQLGIDWSAGASGGVRLGVEAGALVDNEDEYTSRLTGLELLRHVDGPGFRHGPGLRLRSAQDMSETLELAYVVEGFDLTGRPIDVRMMAAWHWIDDPDRVAHRDGDGGLVLLEATAFARDNTALRLGLSGEDAGQLVHIGLEQRLGSWPVSLYVDYSEALGRFRGFDGYNDLAVGFRIDFADRSLKARSRDSASRMLYRYVDVQ